MTDRYLSQTFQWTGEISRGDMTHYPQALRRKQELSVVVSSEPWVRTAKLALAQVPDAPTCACCGIPLTHPIRKGSSIVGKECAKHEIGECRRHRLQ